MKVFIKVCFMICFLCIASCNEEGNSYSVIRAYKAPFNPKEVDKIEVFLKKIANKYDLSVYEKDRSQMKRLSGGKDAFYISYYTKNNDTNILYVTNAGVGTKLALTLLSNGSFAENEILNIGNDIVYGLLEKFNIQLVESN